MLSAQQVHVVSLTTASERRAHIEALFASRGIPFSFFDAVHGKKAFDGGNWPWFYDPEVYRNTNAGKVLSMGDLGCAASHITLWERLVESKDDAWAIFEDDALLVPELTLPPLEEIAALNGLRRVTLLNHVSVFGYRAGRYRLPLLGAEARFPIWSNMLTGAYVIGREAADKLLALFRRERLLFPIDTWGSFKDKAFGMSFVVPVRVVLPPPARQSYSFESAIAAMGRSHVSTDDNVNQSGRIQWRKGLLHGLRFFVRGHLESFRPPKNLPLNDVHPVSTKSSQDEAR